MNALQESKVLEARLLSFEGLKEYLSAGRTTVEEIAAAANAKIKIGGRALYDRTKIDAYLDTLTQ